MPSLNSSTIGDRPFCPKTNSIRSGRKLLSAYCERMLRAVLLAVRRIRRATASPRLLSPIGDSRQASISGETASSISLSQTACGTSGNSGSAVTASVKRSAASWYSVPSSAASTPGCCSRCGARPYRTKC